MYTLQKVSSTRSWKFVNIIINLRMYTYTDDTWQVNKHHPLDAGAFDTQGYCLTCKK